MPEIPYSIGSCGRDRVPVKRRQRQKSFKISAKKNGGAEAPPPDVDAQVRD
jgi:hypothetical protein